MHRVACVAAACLMMVCALAPSVAFACWDGWRASHGRVRLTGYDDVWSVARARTLATWLPRIDALVAAHGAELDIEGDHAILTVEGRETTSRISTESLPGVFAATARALRSTHARRRRAMQARAELSTVELVRTDDAAFAARVAREIEAADLGEHGFYEAGGFPASNPTAHVIGGRGANGAAFVVVVGVFLDRSEAERVARTLARATGRAVRVRSL
ncbi:MAG: hypothetical protein IT379_12850 [Deltaproteobacteria bacterium]|nr:hypothetical protein [Deltaproteobacteria bacterium]